MIPCYQCGSCTASCPWSDVAPAPGAVRRLMLAARRDRTAAAAHPLVWRCTACRACEGSCPHGVPIVDTVLGLRREAWARREAPAGLANVLWGLQEDGNPLRQPPSGRAEWARGLEVRRPEPSDEVLLYVGCTASYDRRARRIAAAAVALLHAGGVRFGVLGEDEPCCGESAKALGAPKFFEMKARAALAVLEAAGPRTVVVVSPHCYDVMTQDYPALGTTLAFRHATEYVAELVAGGRLALTVPMPGRVTYHDPCLLSRRAEVTEAPRTILRAIPGLELVEMADSGPYTLCCGGGGGRAWMETNPAERFADRRVRQAAATGAGTLATACPTCVLHFEDAVKVAGGAMPVLDVLELAARSLAPAGRPAPVAAGRA